MRRLKGAALAVLRVLAVAAVIALIMLFVAVLGGLILLVADELLNWTARPPRTAAKDDGGVGRRARPPKALRKAQSGARGGVGG